MSEDAEDAWARMSKLFPIKQVSLGFNTKVIIGVKLKLKGSNQATNTWAIKFDVTKVVLVLIAYHTIYLILPQSTQVLKVLLRDMNEAVTWDELSFICITS